MFKHTHASLINMYLCILTIGMFYIALIIVEVPWMLFVVIWSSVCAWHACIMVLDMDRTGRDSLRDTRWDSVLQGRHGLRDTRWDSAFGFIKRKSGLRDTRWQRLD